MNDDRPIIVKRQEQWLGEASRRERHALLVASAIGLTMASTGLLPTKISALGIDFSISDQAAMLKLLAAAILYLLLAFSAHSYADYMEWLTAFQAARRSTKIADIDNEKTDEEHMRSINPEKNKRKIAARTFTPLPKTRHWAVRARVAIDVWFPILLATVTVAQIVRRVLSL